MNNIIGSNKFIVKLLPVEGKQDDKVFLQQYGWVYLGYFSERANSWDCKKALDYEEDEEYTFPASDLVFKMYICSQCFKVGDKAYHMKIGEVSEDVVSYIKDGDEFTADQLLQQGTGVNLTPNGGKIKIKCSFGHFH
jgi:hypothetical protein